MADDPFFASFANFQALCQAARRAALVKRRKPGTAAFLARLEPELLAIERALQTGTWRPGGYTSFLVHDPKPRTVSAPPAETVSVAVVRGLGSCTRKLV